MKNAFIIFRIFISLIFKQDYYYKRFIIHYSTPRDSKKYTFPEIKNKKPSLLYKLVKLHYILNKEK